MSKTLMFALTFILGYSMAAQDRTCATDDYMQEALKNPVFAAQHKADQKKFQTELTRRANGDFSQRGSIITIPVAVHFPSGNEADRACLVALAQSQVDILNADYTATNADISNWAAASVFYPALQPGAANIAFCLATSNHPAGVDPELLEGEPAVTIGYNFSNGSGFPEQDSNFQGYMNFLIKDIGAGLLGYSPGGGSIANGGAVVMNLGAFGTGSGCSGSGIAPQAPFNLGRTVTHELGHFYSLPHPWGPAGPSCAADDGFTDTPNTGVETYQCPPVGPQPACTPGQNILSMNYMDYVNDACMYMFTPQQMNAVDAYIISVIAPAIKPNVCEPAVPGFNIAALNSSASDCSGEDVVFDMSYSTVMEFSETTTFSATGQPAGSTLVFDPTSMSVDGPFTMIVGNISGVALGDYVITITGTSTSQTKTTDVVLSIIDDVCDSEGTTQYQTSNTGVIFGDISNLNNGKPSGYSDYTATDETDVNKEESYDLTVNVNTDGNYPVLTRVWIDWNQNCSFDDAGEEYDLGQTINTANDASGGSPVSVLVPTDAAIGATTMRVATKYVNGDDPGLPGSCLMNYDGETEDYKLNVMASLSVGENEFENFAIFPNPNNGEFTVKLNSNSGKAINISVYDIRGRRIFNNAYDNGSDFNQTVKLNNVQSGLYLVTVKDGGRNITKKIVVE